MGNTLKVALVQEVGDSYAQRNAFEAFNDELRADASRVVRVLGGLLVDRPVELGDERVVTVIDTVLLETNNGSQIGFGTEAEAKKTTATLGSGEWAWGEVFADERHRAARHDYARLMTDLQKAEREQLATGDEVESMSGDAVAVLAEATQLAKRRRALTTLCIMAEMNAPAEPMVSESPVEVSTPVTLIDQIPEQRVLVAA